MMNKIFLQIVFVIILSIINSKIWSWWITPIVDLSTNFDGPLRRFTTSPIEFLKYGINALILVLIIYIPFLSDKNFKPRQPYPIGIPVMTSAFLATAVYLDPNIKGMFLTEHVGDDFGFTWPIIYCILYYPFIFYGLAYALIGRIKWLSLIVIFSIGFAIVTLITYQAGTQFGPEWIYLRRTIANGNWLLFLSIISGLIFILNKLYMPNGDVKSDLDYPDAILDEPF